MTGMADIQILRECPFCGLPGRLLAFRFGIENVDRYAVQCDKCRICLGWYFEKDEAVKRWNTRPGAVAG